MSIAVMVMEIEIQPEKFRKECRSHVRNYEYWAEESMDDFR